MFAFYLNRKINYDFPTDAPIEFEEVLTDSFALNSSDTDFGLSIGDLEIFEEMLITKKPNIVENLQ